MICETKGKVKEILQYYYAKDLSCPEMVNELLWRIARYREVMHGKA